MSIASFYFSLGFKKNVLEWNVWACGEYYKRKVREWGKGIQKAEDEKFSSSSS